GPQYFGADGFDKFIEVHTLSHPVAQMIQLTGMIFEGVPEKYPQLRIGFMEAGCSWVPFWMDRMDEEWAKRGAAEAPLCRRKPSDYLRSGQLYFGAPAQRRALSRSPQPARTAQYSHARYIEGSSGFIDACASISPRDRYFTSPRRSASARTRALSGR